MKVIKQYGNIYAMKAIHTVINTSHLFHACNRLLFLVLLLPEK